MASSHPSPPPDTEHPQSSLETGDGTPAPLIPERSPARSPAPSNSFWEGPEPDTDPSSHNTDSALGSEASRSTRSTSLASSIYAYREENGRRYHAARDGTDYNLPNDEAESDRLDLQHHLFYLTLKASLHLAPISKNPQSVLDVGTGTGIWAVDFADQYPSAKVIGTDLSPIQPAYVPPNCHFYIEDAESQWTFANDSFDYIHGRMIVVGIRNWARLFSQAFDALRPGGYIEIQDLCFPMQCDDSSTSVDSPAMMWSTFMIQGAAKLGINLSAPKTFTTLLHNAGFVDVVEHKNGWPLNRWPKDKYEKEKGMWMQQNFLDGLQAFSLGYYTRGLGWTKDEVDVFLASVREQVKDRTSHCYLPIGVWYARKPEVPE